MLSVCGDELASCPMSLMTSRDTYNVAPTALMLSQRHETNGLTDDASQHRSVPPTVDGANYSCLNRTETLRWTEVRGQSDAQIC